MQKRSTGSQNVGHLWAQGWEKGTSEGTGGESQERVVGHCMCVWNRVVVTWVCYVKTAKL